MIGRHRARHPQSVIRLAAAAAGFLLIVAGGWFVISKAVGASCGHAGQITVTVAPELVDAVRQATTGSRSKQDGGTGCGVLTVKGAEPADVAAAVTASRGTTASGSPPQAGSHTEVPDIWIPDTSMWLQRLRNGGVDISEQATSVARSPVVLAALEPAAQTLGWPASKVSWNQVLTAITTKTQLRMGTVDPNRDAAGLSALIALDRAAAGGPTAQQSTVAVMRSLARSNVASRKDLTARISKIADQSKLPDGTLNAAAMAEHAVIAYNASKPPVPLAAIYADPAAPALDYPLVVLSKVEADSGKSAAVAALRKALAGSGWDDRLAAHGLRAADGHAGTGFRAPTGAPPVAVRMPQPDSGSVGRVLSTWSTLTEAGRTLLVLDVSGSMESPVPTAGGASREQVAVAATGRALDLFDDSWQVGLWVFSTLLDGQNDHKQLVPIGPLGAQRGALDSALATVVPKHGGQTGLYDTVLAGYVAVQAGWAPDRSNSLVIATDGRNEDDQGISLDQLIDALKRSANPNKPIQTILLGIGPEVNKAELTRITSATGGGAFIATDPSQIGDIFMQAIALRAAR